LITQKSLTLHLMAWALGALLVVWAGFIFLGYRTGIHEADELTDGHLAGVATLQLVENPGQIDTRMNIGSLPGLADLKSHDYQRSMSVVIWDKAGKVLMRTGEAPPLAFTEAEGFETLRLAQGASEWRVFSRWDGPGHERKVAVLLSLSERDDLAEDIGGQVAEPGFWLLPVVALVLGLAIRRGLRPLYELARDVDRLDIHNPAPLPDVYPQTEFRAVVESINTLASRYHSSVVRERELADELAHELRTPLASITLQAHALRHEVRPAQRDEMFARIEADALRAGRVLSDLLALARADRTGLAEVARPLDLSELARRTLAEFAEAAHQRDHELALMAPDVFEVRGHEVLLGLVLRNLLENALTHTAPGCRIELQIDAREGWLQVCDDSPPDYAGRKETRTGEALTGGALGLGLGHRVVDKIAAIHGASFARVGAPEGFTSCYRISFERSALI
jgi:two-component system sensor histidine kinase QseC